VTAPGEVVAPSRDDGVVASGSPVVGGPLGARAGRHPWWTPVRVMLAMTAVVFALGMVQKAPCAATQWRDGELRYTHMCYSDLPYLYTGRGMVELAWPYSDDDAARARFEPMEYPVGISYWAWGTAWVTHVLSGSPDVGERESRPLSEVSARPEVARESVLYVAVNAVGFAALALLTTWFLAGVHRRRPWDAAAFAVAPVLALTALVNWDLLAVVTVAGALWAWSRDKPVVTGLMIGIGTAIKLYPLFLLGGILVICLRQRRWVDLATTALWSVTAWILLNLPAYVTGPQDWKVFWTFNSDRGPDLGSVWLVLSQAELLTSAEHLNRWTWVAFTLCCLAVLVIGLTAPRTPRLAQLGFLIVASFLILNKVYSPQYVLWLLPLAVLARPRWRDLIVWQATEVVYFASVWWYLDGLLDVPGEDTTGWYWAAILLRVLGEIYLMVMIVRDIYRPEHDPVSDERDPAPAHRWRETEFRSPVAT